MRPPEIDGSAPVGPAAPDTAATDTAPATAAGAILAGRYRLRTRVGSDTAAGAEFWQAVDTILQRDVAITVLRRLSPELGAIGGVDARSADATRGGDDPIGAVRAGEMIVRALRAGCFEHPGCARLLDVLAPGGAGMPDDVLGAAVTEWVPGRGLAEAAADGLIRPTNAARTLQPLAAAAAAAHRQGLVLGCDHPQRIRITQDGRARLCFVLSRPDLRPADDVRGLGAVLYTLLTSRWPLSGVDAARAGLSAANRTPDGTVDPPSAVRPGVPVELDAVAVGTLGPDTAAGRVRTAAAVSRLLDEVVAEDEQDALFPPVHDGLPSTPDDVWQDCDRRARPTDPRRRWKLALGLAALGVGMLIVLGYVGTQLGALVSDSAAPAIVVGDAVAPSRTGTSSTGAPPAGDDGSLVGVAGVEVYDNAGDRDNAGRVSRVIDDDPDSTWRTFIYRQQFPALKPGVGIMVSFASAVQLSSVTVDSPSVGTRIEVRSAPTANADFEDTVPITQTTLEDGRTAVSLAESQPVQHVLLWITELGGGGTENVTEINEVEFRRAGE